MQLEQKIRRGIAWSVLVKFLQRILGFASTIVVVRVLTPDDFGLFALASIVILFSERMGQFGSAVSVIRHDSLGRPELDTAWTIQLLTGVFFGLLILLSAGTISTFFSEPRLVPLIYLLSLRVFLLGAGNIGIVLFTKELNFKKDAQFTLISKVVRAGANIGFALWLQSYWALVISALFERVITIGISYVIHPYRPRLSLSRLRDMGYYSAWVQFASIGGFLNLRLDQIVLGKIASLTSVGFYRVGADLAQLLILDTTTTIFRVLLPAYATVQKDLEKLKSLYLNSFGLMALYLFGITVGFSIVSEDFVTVVYGEKWRHAGTIASWMIYAMGLIAFINSIRAMALSIGHPKPFALLQWTRLAILTFFVSWVAMKTSSDVEMAQIRTVAVIFTLPLFMMFLLRTLQMPITNIFSVLWRPMTASVGMYFSLRGIEPALMPFSLISKLLLEISIGVLVYSSLILILWRITGLPNGPEKLTTDFVKNKLSRNPPPAKNNG